MFNFCLVDAGGKKKNLINLSFFNFVKLVFGYVLFGGFICGLIFFICCLFFN